MTIPKMPERKEEELIANGTMHQAERELSRKIGWNERHDIAEKREEAIVEILYEIDELISNENPLKGKELLENLIDQLQPPEQSPNEELKSEMKERGER